jgi:hypothetical protein
VLVTALVVLCCGGAANSAQAVPPALQYACSPGPSNCSGWYRTAVKLSWDWNDITASPSGGDCTEQTFAADTRGIRISCQVTDDMTGEFTGRPVTIRVDRTPPQLVALAPNRPADYNGWYNRPVGLTFRAVDRTSGVASCSSTSYGGPDGLGIAITGRCTDVAGNVGSGSFPLYYDATPPQRPSVEALPRNRRVRIAWTPSPNSQAEVVRIRNKRAPKLLYRGPNAHFTHRKLHNGRRYRYRVTLIDQAGNRSADRASAVPTASPLLRPANGQRVRGAPLLVWKPVKRATYYNAQLVRNDTKILSSWPRKPRLQLRRRWRFNNHVRRLVAGHYCWYVWPGLGSRSERRYGHRLGKSCFIVVR